MITSVSLRSRRIALLAVLGCLSVPVLSAAQSFTVAMSSSPTPSATVALNQNYYVGVAATPDAGTWSVYRVDASSAGGSADGPTNSFTNHGTYYFTSPPAGATEAHAFTEVNQNYGYYWWQGGALESNSVTGASSSKVYGGVLGYFYTPSPGHY